MLVYLLLQIPIALLNVLTVWIPEVTELPLGLDTILSNGIGHVRFVFTIFPPLEAVYNGFLIVVAFKIALKIFKSLPIVGRAFN